MICKHGHVAVKLLDQTWNLAGLYLDNK